MVNLNAPKEKIDSQRLRSSFRDPSGFLFKHEGVLYRQVSYQYQENYDFLINSGLYHALVSSGLLIPHEEVDTLKEVAEDTYKVIKPEEVKFISYPYEWCFSQLKDAALVTLEIQKKALSFGMTLKDGSAYNIQFKEGKPVLIDTLSFEKLQENSPWVAYRQFCQHFLSPLALMHYTDVRLNQLLRVYLDGLPLDLTCSLLPFRARFNPGVFLHIYLHARAEGKYDEKGGKHGIKRRFSLQSFRGLIDSLESLIRKFKWCSFKTTWSDYYSTTHNYSQEAFDHKKEVVENFLEKVKPQTLWDLGANQGVFSQIASKKGIFSVAYDIDPACVEENYQWCKKKNEVNILPLLLDLTNPSPSIGWENEERMSFLDRAPADVVLALALIHHLAISNNLPLKDIARFLSRIGKVLIIEFVPKSDSQVQTLLKIRDDIFSDYTQEAFEKVFKTYFTIEQSVKLKNSLRSLYLMRKLC